jgi:hypothetical protein
MKITKSTIDKLVMILFLTTVMLNVFIIGSATERKDMNDKINIDTKQKIPEIDRALPGEIATATFALG